MNALLNDLSRLDKRLREAKLADEDFNLHEAMANTIIVLMCLENQGEINRDYLASIVSALPYPKNSVSRAIDIINGIRMSYFKVHLHIGNNPADSYIAEALIRDEPAITNQILELDDNDNMTLTIEHDFSNMVGKLDSVWAVVDLTDLILASKRRLHDEE